MGHADFRVRNKVFATLGYPDADFAMLKLLPAQQEIVVGAEPEVFSPAAGAWGRKGATLARLKVLKAASARSAIGMAWGNIAGAGG